MLYRVYVMYRNDVIASYIVSYSIVLGPSACYPFAHDPFMLYMIEIM